MPAKTPKESFVLLLSHVRRSTERAASIFSEIGNFADDPQVKDALEARAFVSQSVLAKIDQCFKLIGERPVQLSGRLEEIFLEDFRKELNEIQSTTAKRLFVLAKLVHLVHLQLGEYVALTAAADITGNYGVGVLLESCLGDKLAFVERTRRIIRKNVEARVAERKDMEHVAA
jgi:ferritin-like metal-binding protein YciE